MTDSDSTIRRVYLFTLIFGSVGFILYSIRLGIRPGVGFLLGALGSLANLWLFNWLSSTIAPGDRHRKPWSASFFISRYLALGLVAYATVKVLDVSPVPVLLGLLASTAAVLLSSVLDLVQSAKVATVLRDFLKSFAGNKTSS